MSEPGIADQISLVAVKAVTVAICEPQLRLGRRHHDNVCDRCEEPLRSYACERLDFPFDADDVETLSGREILLGLLDAEYRRFCLECSADLERQQGGASS
jgi:hypothetical protein